MNKKIFFSLMVGLVMGLGVGVKYSDKIRYWQFIITENEWIEEEEEAKEMTTDALDLPDLGFGIKFPKPMYVLVTPEVNYLPPEDGIKYSDAVSYGTVFISLDKQSDPVIQIDYGKPVLDGKGGSCIDENSQPMEKIVMLAGVKAENSCQYNIAYPLHPQKEIEYMIWINGSETEMKKYHELVIKGWEWK